jgi:hypothetical protein
MNTRRFWTDDAQPGSNPRVLINRSYRKSPGTQDRKTSGRITADLKTKDLALRLGHCCIAWLSRLANVTVDLSYEGSCTE